MIIKKTNLYAYDDILLEDIPWGKEPDYVYANPSIYDIENNYMVVVNEEGSQLELIDSSSGLLKSIHVSTDMELISHIENILEFYIKSKENEANAETMLKNDEVEYCTKCTIKPIVKAYLCEECYKEHNEWLRELTKAEKVREYK